MHTTLRSSWPLLAALTLAASSAQSFARKPLAPLFDRLGDHHHAITTDQPMAQRYFNQGMVLLYGFNHEEAIRSFRAAATLDPECAMPHWGIAYALGPNINRPMPDSAVSEAWTALQEAAARKDKASPRERAYIDALARRYQPQPVEDRSDLDRAYAEAMREVAHQHPDDLDAHALLAEALMDLMPWNYWELNRKPKPETVEVIHALRQVLRRNPDHPGANHFMIHILEAGPTPEDALASADRLRALRLDAAHLIHMPSHIYIRTGRYGDAIDANDEAARVDRRYISSCRVQGFYPAVYYPHNEHFLWFANVMAGRGSDAVKVARRIEELELDARCGPNPLLEAPRFRRLDLITLARFGRWSDIAKEKAPTEEFPLDLAFWNYAQGLADLAQGQTASAAARLAEVRRLGELQALKDMDSPVFPATMVYGVAEAVLSGKVALAQGQISVGLEHLKRAVALEDNIPYMEPPFWTTPTRQTLGAALLEAGMAADAESVFRADLDRNPRNGWSLYGLQQALIQQRRHAAADSVGREFAQSWSRAEGPLDLSWY